MMSFGKLLSVMAVGLLVTGLSGCALIPNGMPNRNEAPKRTVGHAMVREEVPMAVYTRPGAGGIGPDGRLVVASNVPHVKPKHPVDACGNVITPHFNSAEVNDDQRTLKTLITQKENQLRTARNTRATANNPALKDFAQDMVTNNRHEIERLKHLRKQLCQEARKEARTVASHYKATHTR